MSILSSYSKYGAIVKEKEALVAQVKEMEEFLSDYGLKWKGKEGKFNADQINKELDSKGPAYRNNLPKEIDTNVLSLKIEELNFIAEKQRLVKKGGINRF